MSGCEVPSLVQVGSGLRRTVENTTVRWFRVVFNVVPAWPIGMATNYTRPHYFLRAATRKVLLCLLLVFLVASEVSREPYLNEYEGVCSFVKSSSPGIGRI